MELFGLLFATPVTLVTSLVYTWLMFAVFTRRPVVKRLAVLLSCLVAASVFCEASLMLVQGAKVAYARLGHVYTAIHFLNLLVAPPAVANLVLAITARRWKKTLQLAAGTACCWAACMTVLLGNIAVDEAIGGVDAGKPFYMTPENEPSHAP